MQDFTSFCELWQALNALSGLAFGRANGEIGSECLVRRPRTRAWSVSDGERLAQKGLGECARYGAIPNQATPSAFRRAARYLAKVVSLVVWPISAAVRF